MGFTWLDNYCNSTFWNDSVSWNTHHPDLTDCFEQTFAIWIPCIFLWLLSGLEIYYYAKSCEMPIPWNWFHTSKVSVAVTLCVLVALRASLNINDDEKTNHRLRDVDLFTPLIEFSTLLLAIFHMEMNRRKGLRTSGILFIYWISHVLCASTRVYTLIHHWEETEDYRLLDLAYFVLLVGELLLNCFADTTDCDRSPKSCPERVSGFLSRILFSWFTALAWKGYKKPLQNSDLWNLREEHLCKNVHALFNNHWQTSRMKSLNKQASVLPALIRCFGRMNLMAALLKFIQDSLMFVSPIVLRWLIDFTGNNEDLWKGLLYAVLLYAACSVQTIVLSQYFYKMFTIGIQVKAALISAIYRKSLRISSFSRKDNTAGEIVNLMSVDTQNFVDVLTYLNLIWSSPYQIIVSLYLLWQTLGIAVLSGVTMLIILIPINTYIIDKVKKFQRNQLKYKDVRIKVTNEVLSGIKILKLYAWEPIFGDTIQKIRFKELSEMKKAAFMNAGSSFIWTCAPFMVSFVTFATYVFIDKNNVLNASKAFTSISLFNILRFPMSMLPNLMSNLAQTSVSLRRINKFMNLPEIAESNVTHDSTEGDSVLLIENGNFSWGTQPILKDINVRLSKNSLTAVVGHVGAGKSSLISAFLGEMEKQTGRVNTIGAVAYVSQQAWIQNDTIKNNILFGGKYNEKLYNSVIDACALREDLATLPGGDHTEIGEKGINISGGQKQRVNLARAVYAMRDLYFLDDPLSAVDSHVAKHIFEHVIGPNGLLRNKTRVLSTHCVNFLPLTDQILVLKNGLITERGNYQELVTAKGAFAEFLENHVKTAADEKEVETKFNEISHATEETSPVPIPVLRRNQSIERLMDEEVSYSCNSSFIGRLSSLGSFRKSEQNLGQLTEAEMVEQGSVSLKVYKQYILSIGPLLCFCILVSNVLYQTFGVSSSFWLSKWSNDGSAESESKRNKYLGVYGLLGLGQGIASFLLSFAFAQGFYLSSIKAHQNLLKSCLHALQSFFDTTPTGRILNRFSNDLNCMDITLPASVSMAVTTFFVLAGTLFVISYNFPIFLVIIFLTTTVYFFIQRIYQATSRQLKRLESISRSPIFAFFSETLTGTSTIRAFVQQERFISKSDRKLNVNQACYYYGLVANRWLAVRLESIANLIILSSALFCVFGKDSLSPGIVGLSVSYSLQITQTLNWLVRMICDVETNIVAIERIKEYSELPQEAPWQIAETEPKEDWPENGCINFQDYSVRYRPGLDLVLNEINVNIKGGERVGIVGRTGAGKSSLTLCLFRIIESAGGAILIDGVDISKLGLHSLRSKITVIPQDAVLFSGTLRMNVDPYDRYTDEEIWTTLGQAHLKDFIAGVPDGLSYEVSENGDNFSIGQRQLICLCRALLRKTKLLILDEATAAVDLETDNFLQETIRTQFKGCTILTIAHRLNTVMDYDRIMVLDKGRIKEFDTPNNLIKLRGIFYGMCKEADLVA